MSPKLRGPGLILIFFRNNVYKCLTYDHTQLLRGIIEESEEKCKMVPPLLESILSKKLTQHFLVKIINPHPPFIEKKNHFNQS